MVLTAAGLALTAGCGSGVDEGQVEEFESWARDQPQVQSVDSVTFEEPDTLFGGTNPEVITTLHFSPETSDEQILSCLLYTSPSPRDKRQSRMPSSA